MSLFLPFHSAVSLPTPQPLPDPTASPQTPENPTPTPPLPPSLPHKYNQAQYTVSILCDPQLTSTSPTQFLLLTKLPLLCLPITWPQSLAPNSVFHLSFPCPTSFPPGATSCTRLASRHLLGASHLTLTTPFKPPVTHSPLPAWAAAVPIPLTNLHVHVNGGDSISLCLCSRPRRRRPLAAGFFCSRSNWRRSRKTPTNGLSAPVSLLRP